MKIVSWNIARRSEPWHWLINIDADLALLQEAAPPPPEVAGRLEVNPGPFEIAGGYTQPQLWRTAIVKLSDRIKVEWIESRPIAVAGTNAFAVSIPGTLAAARLTPSGADPIIVVSMYAQWRVTHESTVGNWIAADGSAHRVISDLSEAFIGTQRGHRIIAAGDLNILHGYGEYGSPYWEARYRTVFDRMEALGLPFAGPQHPNGRQADPWPDELPRDSRNVPTYRTARQKPETATRQLDFVFASRGLMESVSVRALNEPEESKACRRHHPRSPQPLEVAGPATTSHYSVW